MAALGRVFFKEGHYFSVPYTLLVEERGFSPASAASNVKGFSPGR